jgi:hypothetical protein
MSTSSGFPSSVRTGKRVPVCIAVVSKASRFLTLGVGVAQSFIMVSVNPEIIRRRQ